MPCLPIFGWSPGAANAGRLDRHSGALFASNTVRGSALAFSSIDCPCNYVPRPHEEVMVQHRSFFKRALAPHRIITGFKNAAIAFHPDKPIERPVGRRCSLQCKRSKHVQRESLLRVRLRPSLKNRKSRSASSVIAKQLPAVAVQDNKIDGRPIPEPTTSSTLECTVPFNGHRPGQEARIECFAVPGYAGMRVDQA
jgi:hypothetical protein